MSANPSAIVGFKAYDYRGRIPNELNPEVAYRIGRAYAEFLKPKRVIVGRDIRKSSEELCAALTKGLLDSGVDIYDIGLCGTEGVYFATFAEGMDGGIMVTASHNPPDYNGMKFVRRQAVMDAGGLVTDDITNAMVDERLSRPDVARGLILDGYPRTTAQAEHLERVLLGSGRKLDRVVSYEVATALVVERIGGRRSCPRCGAVYHVSASPPRKAGRCDKDDAVLVQRDDDRPENVKKRMQEYADKTEPLKRFYQQRRLVTEIDGVGAPESVLAATRAALGGRGGAAA